MDCGSLVKLETENEDVVAKILDGFIRKNSDMSSFPFLNENYMRKRLWCALFDRLAEEKPSRCKLQCLASIRIIGRDKEELDVMITEERIEILLKYAALKNPPQDSQLNYEYIIEALKCLCNFVYNINDVTAIMAKFGAMEALVNRVGTHKDNKMPWDLKIFDMTLLFLLTALSPSNRMKLHSELDGFHILTNLLDSLLNEIKDDKLEDSCSGITLDERQIKFCCEILKTLFNIQFFCKTEECDNTQIEAFSALVSNLRTFLLCDAPPEHLKRLQNLQSDVINLLTVLPEESYRALIIPDCTESSTVICADSLSMKAVGNIINFLDQMLTKNEAREHPSNELLSPVLVALLNISKSNKIFRKYIRKKVLPNLTEVYKRPEEGDTLRNKLCRLLTSPVISVTELVAEWLFVLCKENVGRMVKYTGYGNAAGLFARRGLMGGSIAYSDDSEDSDTEEYIKHKHMINPIVGCRMESHPDPMENMTDEQKEHVAMTLVNEIDKLQRGGIIHPCRIGKDGRPEPIEHVIQLQSELPRQNKQFQIHDDGE